MFGLISSNMYLYSRTYKYGLKNTYKYRLYTQVLPKHLFRFIHVHMPISQILNGL